MPLAGWAEGAEFEFMIDTGCRVTMHFGDVSFGVNVYHRPADPGSAPAMPPAVGIGIIVSIDGMCMTVVFPGLQCDMMLVVASIGFEGL